MCSCDGLGPEQPSLESGLYVPRVTDWNLKMTPKKTNLMPEILKKSKKPVSRMFLKLRLSVHRTVTDLQADSRVRELDDDDVEDLGGSHGGLRTPFSRKFCRNDPICPEFFKEILKTLTQKAIYYTLSVTSWTRRRPQPLFPRGKKGEEIVVMANVYPMTVGNEMVVENVDGNNLKNLNTPVLNELVVKRNELTERHFILG